MDRSALKKRIQDGVSAEFHLKEHTPEAVAAFVLMIADRAHVTLLADDDIDGPYKAIRDREACEHCNCGAAFTIEHPDGILDGASFDDEEAADDYAAALNAAFNMGRQVAGLGAGAADSAADAWRGLLQSAEMVAEALEDYRACVTEYGWLTAAITRVKDHIERDVDPVNESGATSALRDAVTTVKGMRAGLLSGLPQEPRQIIKHGGLP